MPLTPEVWLDEIFVANDSGRQEEPQITQLADGRILVAWQDDTNNNDTAPGTDIIGQLYNILGEPEGSPFRMNSSFFAADEGEFEIAATPDGGWVVAYEDTSTSTSIRIDVFDSTGANVDLKSYNPGTGEDYNDPSVTVAANGDILVSFNVVNGTSVVAHHALFDLSATAWTASPTSHLASDNVSVGGTVQNVGTAALSNGDFIVVTNRGLGIANNDIVGRLVNANGTNSGTSFFSISTGTGNATGVDVADLSGGGFVAVWSQTASGNTEAYFRIFDNFGSAVTSATSINNNSAFDDNNELSVAALDDGGFIVVYDNDETNTISGQRYNSAGAPVGSEFTVTDSGAESQPEAIGLQDGRFAVTWQTTSGTGTLSVGMEILDVRDFANFTLPYTPDYIQVGTVGNDDFSGSADFVYGYDGDDTINDGASFNAVFGGDGDDSIGIQGVSSSESRDGGDGNDWLYASSMDNGTIYNLGAGTVTDGTDTESTTNFENVRGTAADEEFFGDFQGNEIIGGSGQDTINGFGGNDTLDGGIFNDIINGNNGQDSIIAGSGRDTVDGGTDSDTIFGNGGDDSLLGGGGADSIYGGFDDDTLEGGFGFDLLIGQDGNDVLLGQAGGDRLRGGAGDDTMTGGAGADTFQFAIGDGNTRITDYVNGEDQIQIFSGATNFSDITVFDMGADTGLIFANVFVRLENIDHTDIDASDFLF